MWKYHNIIITPGKRWNDVNGTQHPSNWHTWSADEKAKYNITEVVEDRPPDSRLYKWSMDTDGKITSTAKDLDSVKLTLKDNVKTQQGSYLSQTDWAYIRHYDTGTDVPANIETWRNAIRAKATEMENAIDNSTDIDAVADLFVSWDTEAEANSMDKFKEAAAKALGITVLSKEEIEALTPEQKAVYDSDLEKINIEATSKREAEIKKYPILHTWPELEE